MEETNVQKEVNAILLELDFLKECQQSVLEAIKSYLQSNCDSKPKCHVGDVVKYDIDPDIRYQIKGVIEQRYGFAYSISPADEENVTIIAIAEEHLNA